MQAQDTKTVRRVWKDLAALVIAVGAPLAVGGIGSVVTADAIPTWYAELERPAWSPPNWLFGPVWTVLYIAMGVAAWLVWRQGWQRPAVRLALALFAVQLALNLGWTLVFFGLQSPGGALIEIVVLWAFILATIIAFARVHRIAALLLVPYIAWVTFAAVLNGAIWAMN